MDPFPNFIVTEEWKKLKEMIRRRNAVKRLKALDSYNLKNFKSKSGKNLLYFSSKYGKLDVSKYLIDIGCASGQDSNSRYARLGSKLKSGNREALSLMFDARVDISWTNIRGDSDIINFSDHKICKMFYKYIQSHVSKKAAPLTYKERIAQFLFSKAWPLDGIASLRDDDLTMSAIKIIGLDKKYQELIKAISIGDVEKVKVLVKQFTFSKRILSWLLMEVAKNNNINHSSLIVRILFSYGAATNVFEGEEMTLLKLAIYHNNASFAYTLLDFDKVKINYINFQSILKIKDDQIMPILNCSFMLLVYNKFQHIRLTENIFEEIIDWYFRISYWEYHSGRLTDRDLYDPIIKCLSILDSNGVEITGFQRIFLSYFKGIRLRDYILNYKECKDEILLMKKYKIKEKTIYDVLIQPVDKLISFVRNSELVEIIYSILQTDDFKIYRETLKFKIDEAMNRKYIIDQSVTVLKNYFPLLSMCDFVLEKIVNYVGDLNLLFLE